MKKTTKSTKRPSWAPCYWNNEFIKFVRETASDKCWLCKKRLGIKDRSEHSPREHGRCHSIQSESCLG